MSDWIYNGEVFLDPGDNYGFVYIITNKIDNRQYIGKKFFWSIRRKQVKKVRKRVTVESDWKTYWSSSDELQSDVQRLGVENFTREIIHLCPNKGTANYLEAKEQFTRSVLENKDLWYNSWISVKVMRSHVRLS
jgi:hypothetical protein